MRLHPRQIIRPLEYHQFYNLGEQVVRAHIAEGRYTGQRLEYANEWLSQRDTENDWKSPILPRMDDHPLLVGIGAGISVAIFIIIVRSESLF